MAEIDSGDAFDRFLAECEARLATIRRARTRLRKARYAQIGGGMVVLVAVALPLAGPIAPMRQSGAQVVASLLIGVAGMLVIFVVQVALIVPSRRKIVMDEHVMLSDVNQLRELFVNLARQERWGSDRMRATRKRLSQFPIEGETA
jgi:hypothetical protein